MGRVTGAAIVGVAVAVVGLALWLLRAGGGVEARGVPESLDSARSDEAGPIVEELVPAMAAVPFEAGWGVAGEERGIAFEVRHVDGSAPPGGMEVEARVLSDEESRSSHPLDAGGRCRIRGLPASHRIWLRLRDAYGHVVRSGMVLPDPPGNRTVKWTLPEPGRCAAGQVVDIHGRGVPEASLCIEEERVPSRPFLADPEGRFRLDGIFAERLVLVISAPGFAAIAVPESGMFTQDVFVLEEGRTVRLEVVDRKGRLVDAVPELVPIEGFRPRILRRSPGVFDVAHAPMGTFSANLVTLGSRVTTVEFAAGETSVRCQAPD